MGEFFAAAIAIGVVCGVISGAIASSKRLSAGGYFVLGLLLGIIGIIIAAVARPAAPAPLPPGWYSDPWRQAPLRWHDGTQWTYHVHDGAVMQEQAD